MICPDKISQLQTLLQQKEIDAALILNYVDMLYFSGTIQGNLFLVPAAGEPTLFGRRAVERAGRELECGEAVPFKSFKEIASRLPAGSKRIGFLMDSLPVNLYEKLLKDLNLDRNSVVDLSNPVKMLKMVKSPAEIAKIRKAGEMVGKAYHSLTGKIRPGMSENDIAIELEYLLRKNGHLGENRFRAFNQIGLNTYVVSGESVNTPAVHDTPYGGVGVSKAIGVGAGNRKIEKGIPFMIDTVGNFEGYHNDNTRTFIFGEPSPEIREAYENLLEIYHFIVSKLNPDANCEDIYLRTLEKVESMGLSEHFMGLGNTRVPFIGHGIGIEVDEFPVFARKFQVALQPGMTVALEPKLFFEDFGGVGIESTFVITESGNECLSYLPEDMFII